MIRTDSIFVYALIFGGSFLVTSCKSGYESDLGYQESPTRSEQAKYAVTTRGERLPAMHFRIPDDTYDNSFVYGIDISHHNGELPLHSFFNNNIKFVVVKATEGIGFTDRKFADNWLKLSELTTPTNGETKQYYRGAYHFFTPSDPIKQAQDFISVVGPYVKGDLPPTLDMEWTSFDKDRWDRYTGDEIAERALIWLKYIEENMGVRAMIYTNAEWWRLRRIDNEELSKYQLWLANYSKNSAKNLRPSPLPVNMNEWLFWQFTDKGYIDGLNHSGVDVNALNISNKSLNDISKCC